MKIIPFGFALIVDTSLFVFLPQPGLAQAQKSWTAEVEAALARAGKNRPEIEKALTTVPAEQWSGMAFLVANMSERDLRSLPSTFLLENVTLAYQARRQVAWGKQIPEEIFLNDVLPYANVDETREPWRKQLLELCLPLVKDCKTPSEAAQLLNSRIFTILKVRYGTNRKQPHQSPKESMDQGVASCTGLSILLSDACRSVAVPARLAGTPMWTNMRGNHTWVEIWDKGWHFTGACEADPLGLDRGWFVGDAAKAKKDAPLHAIYATSFKKTKVSFPLVWAPDRKDVFAENVTDRYAKPGSVGEKRTRLLIRVRQNGKRVEVPVAVLDRADMKKVLAGKSRGESTDTNDILGCHISPNRNYLVRVGQPVQVEKLVAAELGKEKLLDIVLPASTGLNAKELQEIAKAARDFFVADKDKQAHWKFDAALDRLLLENEEAVRGVVWQAYKDAPIHDRLKKDFEQHQATYEKHVSPYTVKKVGKRPESGWPLFIAMHGGGGAPQELNDSQWKVMQHYYRDQDSVTGYQYLALRAPNNIWNGFYDDYVPPLVINLIRQFLLFGDVDPHKVFLMGYSHGGYGAFFIGPKIPDRFAAVHASAAAPTDGTISPRSLRNTRFTFMIGESDNDYGRRKRCEAFEESIRKLKEKNPDEFPVVMELKKGFGHRGLPDRDKIKDMYPFMRNPVPRRLTWDLKDAVIRDFFWLSVPKPADGQTLEASIRDNTIQIVTRNSNDFDVLLDGRLIAFDKPVRININGQTYTVTAQPQLSTLCRSMLERGDPGLAFTWRFRHSD